VPAQRLESIGETFVLGYHAGLAHPGGTALAHRLDAVDPRPRSARWGAAMALAVVDSLAPWRRAWRRFLDGPGETHAHDARRRGLARARLGERTDRVMHAMDPLLRWLASDGYGFHEGYFPLAALRRGWRARARRALQLTAGVRPGLGRSMVRVGRRSEWIARAVQEFAPERWADLWSGVGLACAYAGRETAAIDTLRASAAPTPRGSGGAPRSRPSAPSAPAIRR
jgi:hypothetical protein